MFPVSLIYKRHVVHVEPVVTLEKKWYKTKIRQRTKHSDEYGNSHTFLIDFLIWALSSQKEKHILGSNIPTL